MKRIFFVGMLAAFACPAGTALAQEQTPSAAEATSYTLQELLALVGAYESATDARYVPVLEQVVTRAMNSPGEQRAVTRALIDLLQSQASDYAKRVAAQQLERLAAPGMVSMLQPLLHDSSTVELALVPLRVIDHPTVEDSLIRALGKVEDTDVRSVLLHELAHRRSERALRFMNRDARAADLALARAAIAAMGQVASPRAARYLVFLAGRLPAELESDRQRALLQIAEIFIAEEKQDRAKAIYDGLKPVAREDEVRVAIFLGRLSLNASKDITPELTKALEGTDAALRDAARGYLQGMADVHEAIAQQSDPGKDKK